MFFKNKSTTSSLSVSNVRVGCADTIFHSTANEAAPSEKTPRNSQFPVSKHAPPKYLTPFFTNGLLPQALYIFETSSAYDFPLYDISILSTKELGSSPSTPNGTDELMKQENDCSLHPTTFNFSPIKRFSTIFTCTFDGRVNSEICLPPAVTGKTTNNVRIAIIRSKDMAALPERRECWNRGIDMQ